MSKEYKTIIAEKCYRRIQWEIEDYNRMHNIKPNCIILGEDVYDSLLYLNLHEFNAEQKTIYGIPFTTEEDEPGFRIGHMRNISF